MGSETVKTKTVSIIGLDRITGSIGLALRNAKLGLTIVGCDADRSTASLAKETNVIDRVVSRAADAAAVADILIMKTPYSEQESTLKVIAGQVREHTLIVDLSILKGPGLKWAEELLTEGHYIGARPILAAKNLIESSQGVESSRDDLFRQSVFCIMPATNADPKAVETAVNLGRILGATPFFLDPLEYDSLVQGLKTAPGLLAAGLFRAVTQAAGWRDMLRFADLEFARATAAMDDPELAHLTLYDKEATLRWLDAIITELGNIRMLVADGDEDRVNMVLENLSIDRESWLHERELNDWNEIPTPDTSFGSIASQMFGFGGFMQEKKKKD